MLIIFDIRLHILAKLVDDILHQMVFTANSNFLFLDPAVIHIDRSANVLGRIEGFIPLGCLIQNSHITYSVDPKCDDIRIRFVLSNKIIAR